MMLVGCMKLYEATMDYEESTKQKACIVWHIKHAVVYVVFKLREGIMLPCSVLHDEYP